MKINYENLKTLVEKISLTLEGGVVYEEPEVYIIDDRRLFVELNGRSYLLQTDNSDFMKEQKVEVVGTEVRGVNNGRLVLFYNRDPINHQRAYIMHALTQSELSVLGESVENAHALATQNQERYIHEQQTIV